MMPLKTGSPPGSRAILEAVSFRLAAATAALVLLAPTAARAQERRWQVEYLATDEPERDMYACLLLPYERCHHVLDLSMLYGGGRSWGGAIQEDEPNDSLQLALDLGYLNWVVERPSLQIGPMVGFEIERFQERWRYRLSASARGRLWAGRWITIEAAVGLVGAFDRRFRARGLGGLAELALGLHGHLGAFVQTQVLSTADGVETRVTGGFRGSFVAWAVIFAGMAG